MTKRILRGHSAESLTCTQIADEMKKRCRSALWANKHYMKVALGDRAGAPRKTKVTITVEFEQE